MAKPILTDELWALIEPLLPAPKAASYGTQDASGWTTKGADGHLVRAAVRYSLAPAAPGDGVRFGDELLAAAARWQEAGVWNRLHELLLAQLRAADRIDWSRVIVDSSSIRALGVVKTGPNPPIARPGSSTISSRKRRASRLR